ncbi:uncharacterized protein [Primulina huaijiensis]|uniref:uncharacterized protein isoform X2 n=1 Tax=Primulina huaijiensis TaxID=1492673 RepID=UPI003CC79A83
MKKDNKTDKFRFVNPHTIPYMPYATKLDKNGKIEHLNERASVLAERLSGASRNQLFLVPYNVGSVRLFNSNKESKEKKQVIWEVVKSTIRKKLMKCDPSGWNAYKIIFTNL